MRKYKYGDRVYVGVSNNTTINSWGTVIEYFLPTDDIIIGVRFDNYDYWLVDISEILEDDLTYIKSNNIIW